ncbi:MAG: dihydroorotate dehydrogenase electron transfer subunit [Deltaproteobacteria bacterium]|nr:dihydroorotate dehydrogenase electron transfer subunit [Deltaproteobacteria bacterium]
MQAFKELAEIVRKEKVAEDLYRLTVKAPDIAEFSRPGQFVMVRTVEGMDPLLRRPFSVHQVSGGDMLQIFFKVIGKGTKALAGMEPGQQVDILGPFGQSFTMAEDSLHILVGGGIGTAPLLFLAKHLLKKNEVYSLRVLLGARTGNEIARVAEDFTNLGLTVDIITEDGSLGRQGLVTDLMTELQQDKQIMVYGCGPYPMLRAVAGICRENSWACQVSLETMMACGLAACLGCAVMRADMQGYVYVCKDGPVLDMNEVAWL